MSRVLDDYIQTYTGRMVSPANIRPEDIDIIDIAHHLSNMPRFCGATSCTKSRTQMYSVAQHSIYVSQQCNRDWALEGLLHDAEEAYLLDMPHPIKHTPEMAEYRKWGDSVRRTIFQKFGLSLELHPSIKDADDRVCETEARDLMPPLPSGFEHRRNPLRTYPWHIQPWEFARAKNEFLCTFRYLVSLPRNNKK